MKCYICIVITLPCTGQVNTVYLSEVMDVDVLIKNGRVVDPGNGVDDFLDVALSGGKIVGVGKDLQVSTKETFDATGCLVTPGLIDAHVHCYEYATPLGANPDNTCLARGVTTVVDAGSSGNYSCKSYLLFYKKTTEIWTGNKYIHLTLYK